MVFSSSIQCNKTLVYNIKNNQNKHTTGSRCVASRACAAGTLLLLPPLLLPLSFRGVEQTYKNISRGVVKNKRIKNTSLSCWHPAAGTIASAAAITVSMC
jgi:hypothetical protein